VGGEGFVLIPSFTQYLYLLFLDLAPILVNWSDIWEIEQTMDGFMRMSDFKRECQWSLTVFGYWEKS